MRRLIIITVSALAALTACGSTKANNAPNYPDEENVPSGPSGPTIVSSLCSTSAGRVDGFGNVHHDIVLTWSNGRTTFGGEC